MSQKPSKLPWIWVSVSGGWDGIADADRHVLFKMAENNPINADFAVRCVNSHAQLVAALNTALLELRAIQARDGAPQHIAWDRGRPLQTDSCTHEWWNTVVERCADALQAAEEEAP